MKVPVCGCEGRGSERVRPGVSAISPEVPRRSPVRCGLEARLAGGAGLGGRGGAGLEGSGRRDRHWGARESERAGLREGLVPAGRRGTPGAMWTQRFLSFWGAEGRCRRGAQGLCDGQAPDTSCVKLASIPRRRCGALGVNRVCANLRLTT